MPERSDLAADAPDRKSYEEEEAMRYDLARRFIAAACKPERCDDKRCRRSRRCGKLDALARQQARGEAEARRRAAMRPND